MIGLSATERAKVSEADAIKRRVRQEAKKARPPKVAPVRTAKPDSALRERRPRVRNNGHQQFIRRLPCIVHFAHDGSGVFPVDAAHVRSSFPEPGWSYTGKAEKPDDWRTLPLCRACHEAQHARGDEKAWWAERGLYPPAIVAVLVIGRRTDRDGPALLRDAIEAGRDSTAYVDPSVLLDIAGEP